MTNRKLITERRKQRQRQQRVTMIMILSGVALIVAAILIVSSVQKRNFETSVKMAQGNALGDPNAPVEFHIYSDFGCGHCANFAAEKTPLIISEYVETGKVYLVYHSVGDLLSSVTPLAAEAAYCAGDQNKFWEYHDLLWANQANLFNGSETEIFSNFGTFALELGLDTAAFNQCLNDRAYKELVVQDGLDARAAGINSTPSFLINGQLLVGNLPYEEFQTMIESELAK